MARWTMIGHHVLHGGYSKNQGRYHRWTFAKGLFRRVFDWLDWMLPEAWNIEHNKLHHYKLGEEGDPDLVERNLEFIRGQRRAGAPGFWCYTQIALSAATWKWFYYAPNVLKEQERSEMETRGLKKTIWAHLKNEPATFLEIAKGVVRGNLTMFFEITRVLAPYFIMMFVLVPLASYLILGHWQTAFYSVLLAEILTNFHSFSIIVPNHAGRDIYKFDTPVDARSDEFYLRAVIGSTNFHTGSDFGEPGSFIANCVDFVHGWLNYQIEHHMFPDMSMLQYQKAAPRIREICKKHGVPYV
jgi:fatty acid desaturase